VPSWLASQTREQGFGLEGRHAGSAPTLTGCAGKFSDVPNEVAGRARRHRRRGYSPRSVSGFGCKVNLRGQTGDPRGRGSGKSPRPAGHRKSSSSSSRVAGNRRRHGRHCRDRGSTRRRTSARSSRTSSGRTAASGFTPKTVTQKRYVDAIRDCHRDVRNRPCRYRPRPTSRSRSRWLLSRSARWADSS